MVLGESIFLSINILLTLWSVLPFMMRRELTLIFGRMLSFGVLMVSHFMILLITDTWLVSWYVCVSLDQISLMQLVIVSQFVAAPRHDHYAPLLRILQYMCDVITHSVVSS